MGLQADHKENKRKLMRSKRAKRDSWNGGSNNKT